MATPQDFATSFARTLDLFRDPSAKEDQKAQFRALAGMLKTAALTLAAHDGRLLVNGAAVNGDTLLQRLEFHAVKEVAIPADPPLAEMFELFKALAEQPGDEDIVSRLRRGGAQRIAVTMHNFVLDTPVVRSDPASQTTAPPPPPPARAMPPPPPSPTPAGGGDIPDIVREATAEAAGFSPAVAASRSYAELLAQLRERPDGPH